MGDNISDAEMDLMKIIWASCNENGKYEPINTNDIMDSINGRWSVSSVFTFLTRLEKKGFITSTKKGRNNYYTAIVDERSYLSEAGRKIVNRLYNGSVTNLLSALCNTDTSENELREIEQFLNERKKSL